MLVGGKLSGALQIVWGGGFLGVKRNPCRLVELNKIIVLA
jgi:hypothetical protein